MAKKKEKKMNKYAYNFVKKVACGFASDLGG